MTTHTIQITEHAVERFRERLRPGLELADAEHDLTQLVLSAELTTTPPAWHLRSCAQIAPCYLVAGDVLLPLKPHWTDEDVLVATTCLVRGTHTEAATRRRRAHRKAGRRRRREVV